MWKSMLLNLCRPPVLGWVQCLVMLYETVGNDNKSAVRCTVTVRSSPLCFSHSFFLSPFTIYVSPTHMPMHTQFSTYFLCENVLKSFLIYIYMIRFTLLWQLCKFALSQIPDCQEYICSGRKIITLPSRSNPHLQVGFFFPSS